MNRFRSALLTTSLLFTGLPVLDAALGNPFNPLPNPPLILPKGANAGLTVDSGAQWNTKDENGTTIVTYTFDMAEPYHNTADDFSGSKRPDPLYQETVEMILHEMERDYNIRFIRIAGEMAAQANLRYLQCEKGGGMGLTYCSSSTVADIIMPSAWIEPDFLRPGIDGYFILAHETGHALGLAHPHGQYKRDGSAKYILPEDEESMHASIMSYYADSPNEKFIEIGGSPFCPSTYMPIDREALRRKYGINPNRPLSETLSITGEKQVISTERHTALDASRAVMPKADDYGIPAPCRLDLRPGGRSQLGFSYIFNAIGGGRLRDAIGTPGPDEIIGNNERNILRGNGGADRFEGQGGDDRIDAKRKRGDDGGCVYYYKGDDGNDTIKGFNKKKDKIVFGPLIDLSTLRLKIEKRKVILTFKDTCSGTVSSITLENISVNLAAQIALLNYLHKPIKLPEAQIERSKSTFGSRSLDQEKANPHALEYAPWSERMQIKANLTKTIFKNI